MDENKTDVAPVEVQNSVPLDDEEIKLMAKRQQLRSAASTLYTVMSLYDVDVAMHAGFVAIFGIGTDGLTPVNLPAAMKYAKDSYEAFFSAETE